MSSMISPARGLVGRSALGILASVAVLAACGTAAATPVTTWTYGFSQLQHGVYDKSGAPQVQDYPGISPNITSEQLDNGLKLYSPGDGSTTFGLTGETYIGTPPPPVRGDASVLRGNRFTNYGGGTIDGTAWQHPDDIIRTTFGFGFDFSGGQLDVYEVRTFFLLSDSEGNFVTGVGSSTGLGVFDPGGYGFGFAFEDRFGANIQTATTIFWGVEIYFDWTGQDFDDTLAFNVPPNSIDIQATTVPAPASAGLLGLGALATIRRRRA